MDIPNQYIPANLMMGMYGIFVQSSLIERFTVSGRHVLLDGDPILNKAKEPQEVDGDSFVCLNHSFFRDRNHVYGLNYVVRSRSSNATLSIIKHCEPATFEPISMRYGRDVSAYFYQTGRRIRGETCLDTLTPFLSDYEKENYPTKPATLKWKSTIAVGSLHVYRAGMKIKGADPATFVQKSKPDEIRGMSGFQDKFGPFNSRFQRVTDA